jgi:hypothetical protein
VHVGPTLHPHEIRWQLGRQRCARGGVEHLVAFAVYDQQNEQLINHQAKLRVEDSQPDPW